MNVAGRRVARRPADVLQRRVARRPGTSYNVGRPRTSQDVVQRDVVRQNACHAKTRRCMTHRDVLRRRTSYNVRKRPQTIDLRRCAHWAENLTSGGMALLSCLRREYKPAYIYIIVIYSSQTRPSSGSAWTRRGPGVDPVDPHCAGGGDSARTRVWTRCGPL